MRAQLSPTLLGRLVAFDKRPTAVIYVTGVYLGMRIAEAYIITPLAQRHAARLPAAITIFSQLLMWKLSGVLGVFVATPPRSRLSCARPRIVCR